MMPRFSPAQARQLLQNTGQAGTDHTTRNTRNQATGKRFEDMLHAYHAGLQADGLARVMRTNPQVRVTGPGQARIVGKGEVDYIALLSNGKTIHFDAKSRAGDAFSLGDEHQTDWLRTMHGYGHRAGYLVYWSDYGQVCWHDIAGIDKRVRMKDGVAVDSGRWLSLLG